MNNRTIITGVVAGAAIGTALGFYFLRKKDKTVSEQIIDKSDAYLEELEEKFHAFVDLMTEKIKLAKLRAANMAGIGTNLATEIAEKGRRRTAEIMKEQEAAGLR